MKLYIISNRLPAKVANQNGTFVFSRSEGGLATGLDSLQTSYEKHWIGWPGICVDKPEEKMEIGSKLEEMNFHPVFCLDHISKSIMKDTATVRFGLCVTISLYIPSIRIASGNLIRRLISFFVMRYAVG